MTKYFSITSRSQLGMTTSTLVETVSLDYEDFTESFLTCSTCLCSYDGQEHTPKLLHCSHTICKDCLERIVASVGIHETGTFRCPICRENITVPRGGVSALPPSFLVNQLLDLMATQRREVIPRCSSHSNQELLFCETCDSVFCILCTGGIHGNRGAQRGSCDHTVIPFSIAIKRMSEILLYKAQECISKLNKACDCVGQEIQNLDGNVDETFESVNSSFKELTEIVEARKQEILNLVKKTRDDKKKVLEEQMEIIQSEKSKVQAECDGLQYQVEVRHISKKINELNEKIDSLSSLVEPRENCYIKYEYKHNNATENIHTSLSSFGRISVSKTFPPLCTASIHPAIVFLTSKVKITTVDYHGSFQTTGGDPFVTEVRTEEGQIIPSKVIDTNDGTYDMTYVPKSTELLKISILIFNRSIKGSPFHVQPSEHINPILKYDGFNQPVSVAVSNDGAHIFVTDTGTSSIKVLHSDSFKVLHQINCAGLEERSGTGIAITPNNTLVVVNWRTKYVTELTFDGDVVNAFTHDLFQEPLDVAVNYLGNIIVADNCAGGVFVFDSQGHFMKKIGSRKRGEKPGQFSGELSSIITHRDYVIVADTRIQIFNHRNGNLVKEIYAEGKGKGRFCGVACDCKGNILATRIEKSKYFILVFTFDGLLKFCIDSHGDKLKRPSGIAVSGDYHAIVVDLGNNSLKKYNYH
ncbi:Tripartite motif-containing protein 2 [Nymphon striatum]|nr:Tripartite motif-containing protein 2 [Nymphon striatum]